MAKLTLQPENFWARLPVPVPGTEEVFLSLHMKHRTRKELSKWLENSEGREDGQAIEDIVLAWDLPEPFNRENIELLLENHIGIGGRLLDFYVKELTKARLGN